MPGKCEHERLKAVVEVSRVGHRRLAGVRLACRDCGLAFRFEGLPFGMAVDSGREALLAVAPGEWLLDSDGLPRERRKSRRVDMADGGLVTSSPTKTGTA